MLSNHLSPHIWAYLNLCPATQEMLFVHCLLQEVDMTPDFRLSRHEYEKEQDARGESTKDWVSGDLGTFFRTIKK